MVSVMKAFAINLGGYIDQWNFPGSSLQTTWVKSSTTIWGGGYHQYADDTQLYISAPGELWVLGPSVSGGLPFLVLYVIAVPQTDTMCNLGFLLDSQLLLKELWLEGPLHSFVLCTSRTHSLLRRLYS